MNEHCNLENEICTPSTILELSQIGLHDNSKTEIIYVGDPMCSWCWGIAPELQKLRIHFSDKNVPFNIIMGGLRPGGGDAWDDQMKNFLRHHWEEVNKRSGQPFGFKLFELESFNYDTEPACRAVVAARPLIADSVLNFFEAIQYKFYYDSKDPNELSFYKSICNNWRVDFSVFATRFNSEVVKQETLAEFNLNRQWGVTGYPAVLLSHNNRLVSIAKGFATYEELKNRIEIGITQASEHH